MSASRWRLGVRAWVFRWTCRGAGGESGGGREGEAGSGGNWVWSRICITCCLNVFVSAYAFVLPSSFFPVLLFEVLDWRLCRAVSLELGCWSDEETEAF